MGLVTRTVHIGSGAARLAALVLLLYAQPGVVGAQPAAAPAGTPARHFDIDEFRVEGNSVLPPEAIEAAVYDFLGPERTAADVEKARAALEELYRRNGYPTVTADVPTQNVSSGVIVLTVTERKVGRLRVTGSRYFDPAVIREGAPSLAPGTVPKMNNVQSEILALNQQSDRSVTPVLRAGRAPDTVDVDLAVTDKLPLHGSLELNNQQSVDTTPLRVSGSLGYDNLFQRGDSANVSFQVAPQRPADALVYAGSYLLHIPGSRLSLLGSWLKSDSNVTTVGSTNVIGKGQIFGLRLLIPLTTGPGFVQALSAGIDYKDFNQQLSLSGQASQVPIQYYPVTATYQATWTSTGSQTDLTASAVMGTRGLGSDSAVFDENRFDATPSFFYVRGAVGHTHDLPWGMQAWARLSGQASEDPLVSNEQLSVGGLGTVRGYYESEVLGDSGIILQTEIRSPSLAEAIGPAMNEFRLHVFADMAHASINNALPQQTSMYSLASVGVGLRMRVFDHLNGELENAMILRRGVSTKSGVDRTLFRLYGDF